MRAYIALLRGINVGGHRKVLMADLRKLMEDQGFSNVVSYIQTGNLAFDSDKIKDAVEISKIIEIAIYDKYAFEVPCIVRASETISKTIENNPYVKQGITDPARLCVSFLKEAPLEEALAKVNEFKFDPDLFEIIDEDVFIYCSKKYHEIKISNQFLEKNLKVDVSSRNWKTVHKLLELANK